MVLKNKSPQEIVPPDEEIPAPRINEYMTYSFDDTNRKIRVYKAINARLILDDMFAKLKINYL